MQDQQVWDIIEAARDAAGADRAARGKWLQGYLVALDNDELVGFADAFYRLHAQAFRWDLWGAAYVMNGGCGDDSFTDFRYWLISEGREVYQDALRDPDSLAALGRVEDCMLEEFGYVPGRVIEKRKLALPARQVMAEPLGTPWDEDQLPALFPRLSTIYVWE